MDESALRWRGGNTRCTHNSLASPRAHTKKVQNAPDAAAPAAPDGVHNSDVDNAPLPPLAPLEGALPPALVETVAAAASSMKLRSAPSAKIEAAAAGLSGGAAVHGDRGGAEPVAADGLAGVGAGVGVGSEGEGGDGNGSSSPPPPLPPPNQRRSSTRALPHAKACLEMVFAWGLF